VRRYGKTLLSLATLVPVVAVLTAVSTVPPSAYALPIFEFASAKGPVRIAAAEFGASRDGDGLKIDDAKMSAAIKRLQSIFTVPPKRGTYDLQPDHTVLLQGGSDGLAIDPVAMRSVLLRAMRGARSNLKLPMKEVKAKTSINNAVVVRLQDFKLDLYRGPNVVKHYTVGVGALSFPTPPGAYYVRSKSVNPTWRNPGSGWARGMPSYIGPGPRNPLGTRALRLDRGALVIHGTPQPWTIGTRSSHGCIRMKRPDVEQLFDLVPEQTPVFIIP
jgi:hypothetical protein